MKWAVCEALRKRAGEWTAPAELAAETLERAGRGGARRGGTARGRLRHRPAARRQDPVRRLRRPADRARDHARPQDEDHRPAGDGARARRLDERRRLAGGALRRSGRHGGLRRGTDRRTRPNGAAVVLSAAVGPALLRRAAAGTRGAAEQPAHRRFGRRGRRGAAGTAGAPRAHPVAERHHRPGPESGGHPRGRALAGDRVGVRAGHRGERARAPRGNFRRRSARRRPRWPPRRERRRSATTWPAGCWRRWTAGTATCAWASTATSRGAGGGFPRRWASGWCCSKAAASSGAACWTFRWRTG